MGMTHAVGKRGRNGCRGLVLGLAVLAALAIGAPTASAHHSYAMFDMTRSVDLKGKVVQFKWTNPHAWLVIEVKDEKGAPVTWNVEMNSPNNLMLLGWKRSTLKAGDDVVITVHPLKGEKAGGSFMSVTLADGRKMAG
ncbi:MAG TPA: DUF6152 family protein [Sphingobium sp.]|nr:DUF6152 family protein [Sphingobium sp.]